MTKLHVKKGDEVVVIAGSEKGKRGKIISVVTKKQRVIVEGVGMIKKHLKPNPQRNSAGGILEQEAPIHISNVSLLDSDGKATRAGFRFEGDKKIRVARSNGGTLAEKKA